MLFNSVQYFLFLPVCVTFYYLFPHRCRNFFLLMSSYFFYMCWIPQYAILMAVSTLTTWLCGFWVDMAQNTFWRKTALIFNIVINLGILFVFKYYNFFISIIGRMLSIVGIAISFPTSNLLLPVGISFYTFQALGYSIDVYRGDIRHERNIINYAAFVSFFPQLVAGPIERSKTLLSQFYETHHFDTDRATHGLRLIIIGMYKKVVIADMAAMYVDVVFENVCQFSGITVAMASILFTIQIYCDFSGYSDVARGSALIFGFRLMENFDAPYFSTSFSEFWSRWHISLSTWFRDYLYIPLGGNRRGFTRKLLNLLVVFLVSGLWHGAALSFLVWGALHGVYRITEELWRKCVKPLEFRYAWCAKVQRAVKTVGCFLLVSFAWIFFRANGAKAGITVINHLFQGGGDLARFKAESSQLIASFMPAIPALRWVYVLMLFLAIGFVFCMDFVKKYRHMAPPDQIAACPVVLRWIVYYSMILSIMFCFVMTTNAYGQAGAFLYFQF